MSDILGERTDLEPNDRVYLVPEPGRHGTVGVVEDNRLSVMVQWDDCDELDFQWSNKVRRVEPGPGDVEL